MVRSTEPMRFNLTSCTANHGALIIVNKTFIKQFDMTPLWKEVHVGRCGRLRFEGKQGRLNLYVCYFNSSDVDDREITRDLIAADMAPDSFSETTISSTAPETDGTLALTFFLETQTR